MQLGGQIWVSRLQGSPIAHAFQVVIPPQVLEGILRPSILHFSNTHRGGQAMACILQLPYHATVPQAACWNVV